MDQCGWLIFVHYWRQLFVKIRKQRVLCVSVKYIWKIHITQYHFQYLQLGISIFSIYIQHPVLSSGQYFYNFFDWFSLKKNTQKG